MKLKRTVRFDRDAIRIYYGDGQRWNAHYWLLNPFLRPRKHWFRRVRNFFWTLCAGLRAGRKP